MQAELTYQRVLAGLESLRMSAALEALDNVLEAARHARVLGRLRPPARVGAERRRRFRPRRWRGTAWKRSPNQSCTTRSKSSSEWCPGSTGWRVSTTRNGSTCPLNQPIRVAVRKTDLLVR